jgi:hypothetical protein
MRLRLAVVWTVLIVGIGIAATSSAQTCMGGPELRAGAAQIHGGGTYTAGVGGGNGGFGGGSNRLFAEASLQANRSENTTGTQFVVSGAIGTQFSAGRGERVAACPFGGAMFGFGPKLGPASLRANLYGAGGTIGVVAMTSDRFSIVPTFAVTAARQTVSVITGGTKEDFPGSTFGLASIGVGFRFNRHRSAIVPSVTVPFAVDPRKPQFAIRFTTDL